MCAMWMVQYVYTLYVSIKRPRADAETYRHDAAYAVCTLNVRTVFC